MKKFLLAALSLMLLGIPAYAGKISDRTSATTPLTGAETIGIIQGGADRKATVGNLTSSSRNVFYADAYGILCDGVTDDTAAIAALGTTAAAASSASPSNTTVVFPSGKICGIKNLVWPGVNLDMNGASFQALSGYDHTLPILKITGRANGAFFKGIAVAGISTAAGGHNWNPTYEETSICVQFNEVAKAQIVLSEIKNCFIGVQYYSASVFTAYNSSRSGQLLNNKVGIDIRTGAGGGGFVNENVFHDMMIQNSVTSMGQAMGIRFSSADDGQHLQNNHRFEGFSFEMGSHSASFNWSSGKTGVAQYARLATGERYWTLMTAGASQTIGTDAPPVTDTYTCVAATNLCTFTNYSPVQDTMIWVNNTGGATPTGINAYQWYWLVSVSGKDFKFANTKGGAEIDITGAGSGTNFAEGQKGWQYTDNAGKLFQLEGVKFRTTVYFFDSGGANNLIRSSRWETGYGPATQHRIARFSVLLNGNVNKFEYYSGVTNNPALGVLQAHASIGVASYPVNNEVSFYGPKDNPTNENITIDNLSRRLVGSASGFTIAGFGFSTKGAWTMSQSSSASTPTLGIDWIKINNNNTLPCFALDVSSYKLFKFQVDQLLTNKWITIKPMDANFQPLAIVGTATAPISLNVASDRIAYVAGSGTYFQTFTASDVNVMAGVPDTSVAKYLQIGLGDSADSPLLRGMSVSTVRIGSQQYGALRAITPWGSVSDLRRSSVGTPTLGWFMSVGEQIGNLNTAGGQPLNWTVKTAGAMAPAYADATVMLAGELRNDGTNVKATSAACTTNGASMALDAGCTWTTQAVIAVLTASTQTY